MKPQKSSINILEGNLVNVILMLAVPVALNSFLQTLYNLTDTYWMGRLGTVELAAINLVSPVQNLVVNFGSGITVAGSVLIAQSIGANRLSDGKSMLNQIFVCAVVFAVVCSGLVSAAASEITRWLGADGDTLRHGTTYLRIVILDMTFLYMINIFSALSHAQGDTMTPMLLNVTGIMFNLVLDPLFMFTFGWGVAGAALATISAKVVPAVIAFALLHNRKKAVYMDLRKLRFEKDKLQKIVVIGLPTAVGGSTMQLGFMLMGKHVFRYGTQAMAAYGIGNKVNGLISLPSNGIGSAVAVVAGQNIGAGQLERAEKGYRLSRKMIVIFLLAGGLILSRRAVSGAIVGIFTNDPQVIEMAAEFLSILSLFCWTNGIYNTTIGLFQGSGHTQINMLVEASRLWVFRFAALFFCQRVLNLGISSIWYSVVISNGISAAVLYLIYKTEIWKKKRI